VPRGLGTGRFGGCHCSCESHSGGLAAGTLHLKAFETLAFFLSVTIDDLEIK
jgi:hypothetical protein